MIAPSISDGDFQAVRVFVYRELGVALNDSKRALVVTRLGTRVRALGVASYREYVRYAAGDPAEKQRLIDAITTNETRFFREPVHFELLARKVLPDFGAAAEAGLRPRTCRIWSAGCSTGEEPYSIAMVAEDALPYEVGWTHEVLATDVSARALDRARQGVYAHTRKADVPERLLKRFMLRGVRSREGLMCVTPQLRSMVQFDPLNLNDVASYPRGEFDAIFCRNVLIYFDGPSRQRVIDALIDRLTPGGYLFLGHAESLSGREGLRSVAPNAYRRSA